MDCDTFIRIVLDKFQFLVDEFQFKEPYTEQEWGFCTAWYLNNTTGVEIMLENRDQFIMMRLHRLTDGRILDDYFEERANSFPMENGLLDIRAPGFLKSPNVPADSVFAPKVIEEILDKLVVGLRQYAKDVLLGDFTILPEVKALIKKRT